MKTMRTSCNGGRRTTAVVLSATVVFLALTASSAAFAGGDLTGRFETTVLYIPNAADGTVSAVDPGAATVLWEIRISEEINGRPAEAAHGIAVSPDGSTLYAGDRAAGELVVVDTASREVRKRVEIPHGVHGVDISPDGATVWVAGSSADMFWLGELSVFDTEAQAIIAHIAPGVGSAEHLDFSPDGSQVWVASVSNNLVWTVDGGSFELASVVALPQQAGPDGAPEAEAGLIGLNEVAVAPDGRRAYAVGPASARLFAIDAARAEMIASTAAEPRAHGVAVSPDGAEVWVANRSGSVSVFAAETLELLASIPTGAYANHVAVHPDGRRAFVTGEDELLVVDIASRQITDRIPTGADPHEIAVAVTQSNTAGRPRDADME